MGAKTKAKAEPAPPSELVITSDGDVVCRPSDVGFHAYSQFMRTQGYRDRPHSTGSFTEAWDAADRRRRAEAQYAQELADPSKTGIPEREERISQLFWNTHNITETSPTDPFGWDASPSYIVTKGGAFKFYSSWDPNGRHTRNQKTPFVEKQRTYKRSLDL